MKRTLCLCVALCFLCGCAQINVAKAGLENKIEGIVTDLMLNLWPNESNDNDVEKASTERFEAIMAARKNNDTDAVLEMFSPYVRETTPNLQQGAEQLFSLLGGEVLSYERGGGHISSKTDSGHTEETSTFSFRVSTTEGEYIICILACIADDDAQNIGVQQIIGYNRALLGQLPEYPNPGIYVEDTGTVPPSDPSE